MSQREDLLRGARQCIVEKGYARTTARDITAASGANLASIGYYFGSKEALLRAAVIEAFDAWGDALEDGMANLEGESLAVRLEQLLTHYVASLPHGRDTLGSSLQALAEAEYSPEVREQMATKFTESRRDLTAVLLEVPPDEVPAEALPIGSMMLAMVNGYAMQWFIDPDSAPSAEELLAAMRRMAGV